MKKTRCSAFIYICQSRGRNYVTYINLWWWENCCGKDAANCGKCVGAGAFTGKTWDFWKWGRVSEAVCHQGRWTGDTGSWYAGKKWNWCLTGAWKNSEKWSRDSSHSVW